MHGQDDDLALGRKSILMQWLLQLETERDPISTCRLMNIFRRKGVSVLRLELESGPASLSILALVETKESDVPHLFHFLRRTEGVREVTCYRHEAGGSLTAGADGHRNGVAGTPGKLVVGEPSSIIHTSKSIHSEREETAGPKALVERLAVNE